MRTVTKKLPPGLMKSEYRIITRGPTPYDGREGMLLRLSKKVKSSANSEDESEDDQTSVWHHIAKEAHLA